MLYLVLINIYRCSSDSNRFECDSLAGFFLYNTVDLIAFTFIRLSVHGKGS